MIDECYVGDVRDGLRAMIAAGVKAQTCVTSPPYWGLRDYGVAGQIGLEPTIAEYVAAMVEVFRMARDVLADDGTLWLNLGDSYSADRGNTRENPGFDNKAALGNASLAIREHKIVGQLGLKPKDLCGVPWRVAFALQADGWYLRSDIIWSKPNPMPESVTDRPTKAHEYLFLLAKSERYYYNAEAVAERRVALGDCKVNGGATGRGEHTAVAHARDKGDARTFRGGGKYVNGREKTPDTVPRESRGNADAMRESRNRRTVWTIASEPFPDAHFATFPSSLVEPCVLAGSRPSDVVLDPFMGSGTVAKVAQSLGRHWVGCELNPAYVEMQKRRASQMGIML